MKLSRLFKRTRMWALCLALLIPGEVQSQEFINRREEARAAVLATPRNTYAHYCAHCHGDDATGTGRLWASELSPQPADLTRLGANQDYLVAAIRDGSAAHGKSNLCPPWGPTISTIDIERLAQYIVSLAGKGSPAASMRRTPWKPAREPFPWVVVGLLLAETGLLWRMLRPGKGVSHGLSDDPALRG